MKRIIAAFCAAVMLCSLGACAKKPEPSAEFVPAPTQAAEPTPTAQPDEPPVLSPGAATESQLSGLMQAAEDGVTYTSLVRAEGFTCLYDRVPEEMGYIAGFIVTDDGVYAALREFYFSLDPAALYFFPDDGGEPRLLSEELSSNGIFCIAGDGVFCYRYDGSLMRIDLISGEAETVMPDGTFLLGSDGGFIYYEKPDGVYRNDSTMSAEALLFETDNVSRLFFDDAGLYDLTYTDEGTVSVVELRGIGGTLKNSVTLDETTDNIWFHAGRIYAPQTEAGRILVLDAATGDELDPLPLDVGGSYCLIRGVTDDALYYESYQNEQIQLFRLALDGSATEPLGEVLMF